MRTPSIITRIADIILRQADDYRYSYDPEHRNRPDWRAFETDKGWSNDPKDDPKNKQDDTHGANYPYELREEDHDYFEAVKNGDEETASSIVKAFAENSGYTSPVVYHGSGEPFNEFKRRYERDGFNSELEALRHNRFGKGIFFTDKKDVAEKFGKVIRPFYLKTDHLREFNLGGADFFEGGLYDEETGEPYLDDEGKHMRVEQRHLPDEAAEDFLVDKDGWNYGVLLKGIYESIPSKGYPKPMSNIWVVANPSQIKSAETIVKDDQGNIIPPSQRFNSKSNDTRY